MNYYTYIASAEWNTKRAAWLSETPNCQNCGLSRLLSKYFYKSDLHIHHLRYDTLGNEDRSHVQILCPVCHEIVEQKKRDADGKMVQVFHGFPEKTFVCPYCQEDLIVSHGTYLPWRKNIPTVYLIRGCECEAWEESLEHAANDYIGRAA